MLSPAQTESFRPALFKGEADDRVPAYVIEEHADGKLTILLPWAPTAFAGSLIDCRTGTNRILKCFFGGHGAGLESFWHRDC